jgi:hypothetical protein
MEKSNLKKAHSIIYWEIVEFAISVSDNDLMKSAFNGIMGVKGQIPSEIGNLVNLKEL